MKLAAILRVKNEIINIEKCLLKLSSIADEIFIVDNGSTDGTLEVYTRFSNIKKIIKTEGFNEGRDKILLLNEVKKTDADWIIWIDGDEVFENHMTREVMESYMNSKYNKISFRMCNFWLDYRHFRFDGSYVLYTVHPQRSMWRNTITANFADNLIHNGDIRGIEGPKYLSPYRLKHFGYSDRNKMIEKYNLYKEVDRTSTRSYEHLNPNHKVRRFVFREYKNKNINYVYIIFLKYLFNAIWLLIRIKRKLI